ncbi:hypothetical protein CAEBREN_05613 [Caenorhabditis brenneri]|uniref:Uncharacterized protein n=1 Tax=Caenorhabditis brenneri TaxID=135651 RepID=G0MCI3_CAEBE|nr:hypothetical protein CAEBREN_05613 [Caenorhabditis brenneri]
MFLVWHFTRHFKTKHWFNIPSARESVSNWTSNTSDKIWTMDSKRRISMQTTVSDIQWMVTRSISQLHIRKQQSSTMDFYSEWEMVRPNIKKAALHLTWNRQSQEFVWLVELFE